MKRFLFLILIALFVFISGWPSILPRQQATAQEKAGLTEHAGALADTTRTPPTEKSNTSKAATEAQKSSALKAEGTKAEAEKSPAKSTLISPDKGIGPIKEIKLISIDTALAAKGEAIFQEQCISCHLLDKKKIGPPLRDVIEQRPPEFIMNMMLNTDEMERKDPEIKKLIAEYGTYMSILDINKDQARQILEYLRRAAKESPSGE